MKLYRFTRGPFKSSKFGKLISEARDHLLAILQKDRTHEVLTPWLAGMARDCSSPLRAASFDPDNFDHNTAYEFLKNEKGGEGCWGRRFFCFCLTLSYVEGGAGVVHVHLSIIVSFMLRDSLYSGLNSAAWAGRIHVTGSAVKDSRWFSFWDNGMAWDRQWHSLAMSHAFSFWLEGRNPWALQTCDDGSEDSHSMRAFCWHAAGM